MDLQQIEARHAPGPARRFDLRRARGGRRRSRPCRPRTGAPARRACRGRSRSPPATSRTSARNRSCRPPASKKARMTSAQASRATGSSPTLKVIQLPSPTTGRASPVEGIGLVRMRSGWADATAAASNAAAPVAAKERSSLRRLSGGICLITCSPSTDAGFRPELNNLFRHSCGKTTPTLKTEGYDPRKSSPTYREIAVHALTAARGRTRLPKFPAIGGPHVFASSFLHNARTCSPCP